MPKFLLLFRTHVWDDFVARMALQTAGASEGGDFVVLADETRGPLNAGDFDKIGHDSDFTRMGLPSKPSDKVLWYNADYPLYAAYERRPDYDYYVMVEYDVMTNTAFGPIIDSAAADGLDFIAHNIERAEPDWYWSRSVRKYYDPIWRALMPVLVLSNRAVAHLYDARRRLAERIRSRSAWDWPYFEPFIPSELMQAYGSRWRELSDFANAESYRWWPPYHAEDPVAQTEGAFVHPVLDESRMIASTLKFSKPVTFFEPDSPLRRQLGSLPPRKLVAPLKARLAEELDYRGLNQLRQFMAETGVSEPDFWAPPVLARSFVKKVARRANRVLHGNIK
jgi:hypothetical protein